MPGKSASGSRTGNRGGRPIKPPAWQLDTTIGFLREALSKQPANVPVSVGRAALAWLEKLQEERAEVYKARHTEELYAALVTSYNAIIEEARERGVEVFQPMYTEAWHWTRGDLCGQAPTPAEALVEALTQS